MESHQLNHKKHNVHWNIINGIAFSLAVNLVNPFYSKFALRLGGTDSHITYLSSLPALFSIIALIPGAILIDILGRKQHTTSIFMFLHKIFFLAMAALPFMPDSLPKPLIFVLLVAFMNLPGAIYVNGYNSSLGDVFTESDRGGAMALRTRYSDITKIIVTILAGLIMQIPRGSQTGILHMYAAYFVVAFAAGIFELVSFKKFSFPPVHQGMAKPKKSALSKAVFKESLKYTFENRNYRMFWICSMIWHIGWVSGWPIFSIYTVKTLQASEAWLSAGAIAGGLSAILTATLWMRLADKYTADKMVVVAIFGMSITPFLYRFSTNLYMITVSQVLVGISVTGTVMLLLNMILKRTPPNNRTTIMSIYTTMVAIVQSFAPFMGLAFLKATDIKTTLTVNGIMRFVGCLAFFILYLDSKKQTAGQPPADN